MLNCTIDRMCWKEFMKKNDIYWDKLDDDFFNGAFIGDGKQGAMIMLDSENPSAIRMLMGKYDVVEHSMIKEFEYCKPRLFCGSIIIDPKSKVENHVMRMNLWSGTVNGGIQTDIERIKWHALTDREHGVFIISLESNLKNSDAEVYLRPEWGITPSFYQKNKNVDDFIDQLPPKPENNEIDGINITTQKHRANGGHAVAWKTIEISENKKVFLAAISVDYSEDDEECLIMASSNAAERINEVCEKGIEECIRNNKEWWHNYNQESFLELPDDIYWQNFWWQQIYKFGCASAEDSDMLIDNEGPWSWKCNWGAIWWNLNVQLSYYPTFTANKLKNARSFINGIDRIYKSGAFHKNSNNSVGITIGRASSFNGESNNEWAREYGNLTWVLHNYWKFWKYTGDDELGKKLFPMLKDNVDFLISKLVKKDDGKFHMLPSRSPEYPHPDDKPYFEDTNYALMGLKWALITLIEITDEFNIDDEQSKKWNEVLDDLIEYPVNEYGLKINAEQGYDKSHRHYSHLLAIYPYHTLNPEKSEKDKELIHKSLDRWQSLPEALQGYSFTGGCAMYATLEDGNTAINILDKLKGKLEPNTMYKECGGPVIETPLSAVESINYLLLQSWGSVLRVFPAVPDRWKNISFCNFRTEGAFLISGRRENEKNIFVSIKNPLAKTKTVLIRPNLSCDIAEILITEQVDYKILDDNKTFELILLPGQEVKFTKK